MSPSSSRAPLATASTSGSPKRTVPPGRCHMPLHGSMSRSDSSTPRAGDAITTSTVSRGTRLKIQSNSSLGRRPRIRWRLRAALLALVAREVEVGEPSRVGDPQLAARALGKAAGVHAYDARSVGLSEDLERG